jgi:hypothetical protein
LRKPFRADLNALNDLLRDRVDLHDQMLGPCGATAFPR